MPEPLMEAQTEDLAALLVKTPGPEPPDVDSVEWSAPGKSAHVNVCLERMVTERAAKLRELIAELDDVSYALVHDMRAPLRAIREVAQMLEGPLEEMLLEKRKDCLRRITNASNRLDKLIEDALAYHRAVLRVLPLEAVDLGRLMRRLLEADTAFDPKRADIRIEGDLPLVLGNEALFIPCFSNLLDNAVKFVVPGTRPQVRIRSQCTSEVARIWVEDNGIGIPQTAQKRLFALFQELHAEYEGTGLGLFIVRKVVERMDGKLGVESEPGKGSRFWVEFKRVNPH